MIVLAKSKFSKTAAQTATDLDYMQTWSGEAFVAFCHNFKPSRHVRPPVDVAIDKIKMHSCSPLWSRGLPSNQVTAVISGFCNE